MKNLLLVFTILLITGHYGSAQSVVVPSEQQNKITDPDQEKLMKAAMMQAQRQNTPAQQSEPSSEKRLTKVLSNPHTLTSNSCSCDIPLDSTFMPVPFTGTPCSGCPGTPPLYRNDD